MELTFRHGIVRYPTELTSGIPAHIKERSDRDGVAFDADESPTLVTFSHGEREYLVELTESKRDAWVFSYMDNPEYYLYVDLNMVSGMVSFGYSKYAPILHHASPAIIEGQHWFDSVARVMKVCRDGAYTPVLRVFLAVARVGSGVTCYPTGSQAGINESYTSGFLLYDQFGTPVRDSLGYFITSDTYISTSSARNSHTIGSIRAGGTADGGTLIAVARGTIPRLRAVTLVHMARDHRVVEVSTSMRTDRVVTGISGNAASDGETVAVVVRGVVNDPHFNFPSNSVGRFLFCGEGGELTLIPPSSGISQIVGKVIDVDGIEINVQPPVRLTPRRV